MCGRKNFIGVILGMAVCFSACSENASEVTETSSEISVTEAAVTSGTEITTEKITISETETNTPETETSETKRSGLEKLTDEEVRSYFEEHGYEWEKGTDERYIYSDILYINLANFSDGTEPLSDLEDQYLKRLEYIVIRNADNADLSFIHKYTKAGYITIENYSGRCDFSNIRIPSYFSIYFDNYMGGDLSSIADSDIRGLTFENYDGNYDLTGIADLDNISSLTFDNYSSDNDLRFVSDCENITVLNLRNKSIDAETTADILGNSNIKSLFVTVEDYRSADADLLMKTAPTCNISYSLDNSPCLGYKGLPTEGVVFCTNVDIIPGYPEEKWECRTSEAKACYPGTWKHYTSLVSTFTNFTNEKKLVSSVQIFRYDNGILTAMPFADGSTTLEIDFTVNPNENSDFDITEEMFPFSKCEPGIYRVVFDVDGEKLEQQFFICSNFSDGEYPQWDESTNRRGRFDVKLKFLSEEQQKAFKKAYEITFDWFGFSIYMPPEYIESHTTEEFLAGLCEGYTYDYAYSMARNQGYIDENGELQERYGDRGGDISHQGECFELIYADENEVLFKNTVIYGHDGYPYFIWFEEINYHMVKTEDGWRFDKFRLWY